MTKKTWTFMCVVGMMGILLTACDKAPVPTVSSDETEQASVVPEENTSSGDGVDSEADEVEIGPVETDTQEENGEIFFSKNMDAYYGTGTYCIGVFTLYYQGNRYEEILSTGEEDYGEELGTVVHYDGIGDYSDIIFSNALGADSVIYKWGNYDPAYRLCGRSAYSGDMKYFERSGIEDYEMYELTELFPEPEEIRKISIYADSDELAILTEPEKISGLIDVFLEEAEFIERHELMQYSESADIDYGACRSLELTLTDGSVTEVRFYENGMGEWIHPLNTSEAFMEHLNSYVLYEPNGEWIRNYGAVYAKNDIARYSRNEDGDNYNDYVLGDIRVSEGELRMSMGFWDEAYAVLAEDAAGFARIEGKDIWYLDTAGQVIHFQCAYPWGEDVECSIYEALEQGMDFQPYMTEKEVVQTGPYTVLQVRDGVIWTLSTEGLLACNDIPIRDGVSCFVLDGKTILYGRADGLYRIADMQEGSVRIEEGNVTTVASAGLYVYYATEAGELYRIRVDGNEKELIYELSVTSLYAEGDHYNEVLIITTAEGKVYYYYHPRSYLYQDRVLYRLMDGGVRKAELSDSNILHAITQDGIWEAHVLSHEGDALYFDWEEDRTVKIKEWEEN